MGGRADLIRNIEDSWFLIREIAGEIFALDIPGIRGRYTHDSNPFSNLVGTTGGGGVPVESVRNFFREKSLAFGWVVGPLSPPETSAALEACGLVRILEVAGMALTDIGISIASPDDVLIEEIPSEASVDHIGLIGSAFGLPSRDMAAFMARHVLSGNPKMKIRTYLAYKKGARNAIGIAATTFLPDGTTLLSGAGVLPEHRRGGVYRAFVKRRLRDALQEGATRAVIQAARTTSAPICRKLGFEEICSQELYAWFPNRAR